MSCGALIYELTYCWRDCFGSLCDTRTRAEKCIGRPRYKLRFQTDVAPLVDPETGRCTVLRNLHAHCKLANINEESVFIQSLTANCNVLSYDYCMALGLKIDSIFSDYDKVVLQTPFGAELQPYGFVRTKASRVGEGEIYDVEFLVADLIDLNGNVAKIDGIIGWGTFFPFESSKTASFCQRCRGHCAFCGATPPKLFKCSGCDSAKYCNAECQLDHWPRHEAICRKGTVLHAQRDFNVYYH